MSRGLRGWFKRDRASPGAPNVPGEAVADVDVQVDHPAADFELHVCCICGALLGFDREDEIDGEGPGRDICGSCNRTRNDDSIELGW